MPKPRPALAPILALMLAPLTTRTVLAQAPSSTPAPDVVVMAARDAIWEKEKKIYEGRAEGGLTYYLANASDRYVGWPPGLDTPSNLDALRKSSAGFNRKNSEKLTLTFTDFTLHDSTAVIYYQTHRTMRPDGTPVNERFDTIHVWVREGSDWKLIGAMARPRDK